MSCSGWASRAMISASSASSGRNGSEALSRELLGESEQALIETGMLLLHFLRGAAAVHAHERHNERGGNRPADAEEQHEAARGSDRKA